MSVWHPGRSRKDGPLRSRGLRPWRSSSAATHHFNLRSRSPSRECGRCSRPSFRCSHRTASASEQSVIVTRGGSQRTVTRSRHARFASRLDQRGAVERCSWSRPGVGPSARSPGLDNRAQSTLSSTNGVSTIAFMNNARNLKNPQRLGRSCAEDRRRMLRACAEFPFLDPSFIRDEKHVLRPCRRQGPVQGRKHGLPGCGQRHQVGIRQLSVSPDPGEWDIDVGDRVRPEID